MDMKICLLLLGLLQQIQSVQSNTDCSDGLFRRLVESEHVVTYRCCRGITCPQDFEIKPCAKNGEEETCHPCPSGTTRPGNTSSVDPKRCFSKSVRCSEDAEPVPNEKGDLECRCKSGYCGEHPSCQHVSCPPGKSADPITCECIMKQLSTPTSVSTSLPSTPPPQGGMTYAVNTTTAGTTAPSPSVSAPTTGLTTSEGPGNENGSTLPVVLGSVAGTVAAIAVGICFFWWKRRASQNRRNGQEMGGQTQHPQRRNGHEMGGQTQHPQRNGGSVSYTAVNVDEAEDHTPQPLSGRFYLRGCNNVQISIGTGDNTVANGTERDDLLPPSPQANGGPASHSIGGPTPSANGVPASHPIDGPTPSANGGPASHPIGGPTPSANGGPASHPIGGPTPSANGGPASHPIGGPTPSANGGPASHPIGGPTPSANGGPASLPIGGPTPSANGVPAAEDIGIPSEGEVRRPIEAMGSPIQEEGPSEEDPHASM